MSAPMWLSPAESDAWRAIRDLGQTLWAALGRDLQRDTGLSMADYQILVVLSEHPDDTMPYGELAQTTGWEKSRLSHQLTRMEGRALLERLDCSRDGRSADIRLTATGRTAVEAAAPGHVASVRRLAIDLLSPAEIDLLAQIGARVRAAIAADASPLH